MCYQRVLDRNRCEDIASRNTIDPIIYGIQRLCVRYIGWWNRHAVIERPFEMYDIINHGRDFMKCLLVGYEEFRYLSWKERHDVDGHGEGLEKVPSKESANPCHTSGRYWESWCASCWCQIRPRAYHFRERVDICLVARLKDTELCPDCQIESEKSRTDLE